MHDGNTNHLQITTSVTRMEIQYKSAKILKIPSMYILNMFCQGAECIYKYDYFQFNYYMAALAQIMDLPWSNVRI